MKKVSVTDKYTYDGEEMSEREREIISIEEKIILFLLGAMAGEIYYALVQNL